MKILIYGLPGSGKTYLAEILAELLGDQAVHLNIDSIRKETGFLKLYDSQGELLVPNTIQQLAEESVLEGKIVIVDGIFAKRKDRELMNFDFEIYLDTIKNGNAKLRDGKYTRLAARYEDPVSVDYAVTEQRHDIDARIIVDKIMENK